MNFRDLKIVLLGKYEKENRYFNIWFDVQTFSPICHLFKKKEKKTSILSNTVVTSSYHREMQNEKKEKVKFVA